MLFEPLEFDQLNEQDVRVGGDIFFTRTYKKFGSEWREIAAHGTFVEQWTEDICVQAVPHAATAAERTPPNKQAADLRLSVASWSLSGRSPLMPGVRLLLWLTRICLAGR
jgi:hypothetical protein